MSSCPCCPRLLVGDPQVEQSWWQGPIPVSRFGGRGCYMGSINARNLCASLNGRARG